MGKFIIFGCQVYLFIKIGYFSPSYSKNKRGPGDVFETWWSKVRLNISIWLVNRSKNGNYDLILLTHTQSGSC